MLRLQKSASRLSSMKQRLQGPNQALCLLHYHSELQEGLGLAGGPCQKSCGHDQHRLQMLSALWASVCLDV